MFAHYHDNPSFCGLLIIFVNDDHFRRENDRKRAPHIFTQVPHDPHSPPEIEIQGSAGWAGSAVLYSFLCNAKEVFEPRFSNISRVA